jgi:hypothetical protein
MVLVISALGIMNTCGWFKFEYDPLAIRHVHTNQSVTVRDGGALNHDGIWSCEYVSPNDGDSVLLDIKFDITCSRNFQAPTLRLDYNSVFTTPPDYLRWKFIDDFLTDALTCWPKFLPDRKNSPDLHVEGAWCNGRWTPSLTRVFSSAKDGSFLKRAQTSTPAGPYTLRQADRHWEYVDYEIPQQKAALDYTCLPPSFVPFLGRNEVVTGFQGKVPYLVTKDRRTYIIPILFSERMEHDYCLHPHAKYMYVNEDVFYQFEMRDQSVIFMNFVHCYGFRDLMIEKNYWPLALKSNWQPLSPSVPRNPDDSFSNLFKLPYHLWKEGMDAITDAWSAWRRPSHKVVGLNDSFVGGFTLNRATMKFFGGYSAGLSNDNFCVRYTYA